MEIKYFTKDHEYTQTIEADSKGELQESWTNKTVVYNQGIIVSKENLERLKRKEISLSQLETLTEQNPLGKHIILIKDKKAFVTLPIIKIK
jgi:hypothetical protein